jgi:hypothetical protein
MFFLLGLLIGAAEARVTRCDTLTPLTYSGAQGEPFLRVVTNLQNIQIGSRPGILASATSPVVLGDLGTDVYMPVGTAEYSYFWADNADYFYSGCRRVWYPRVNLSYSIGAPVVSFGALMWQWPSITWSMPLQRLTWVQDGWEQYFLNQPPHYCILTNCVNPFECIFAGTINGTRAVAIELTTVRAGIGLSSDLYAYGGCIALQLGRLNLTVCQDAPPVCRLQHCRASIYEMTGTDPGLVLLGMDPLISDLEMGLALHWRPEDQCGTLDVGWDETVNLMPNMSNWVMFLIVLLVWCAGMAFTETERRQLLMGAGQPDITRSKGSVLFSKFVVRVLPVLGSSAVVLTILWNAWFSSPSLGSRIFRGTSTLPTAFLHAIPTLSSIGAVLLFFGIVLVCWRYKGAQTGLDLFHLPLLLLALQIQFTGGSVHDWSTYFAFTAALVQFAELGRCFWLTVNCRVPWRLTLLAAMVWLLIIPPAWGVGIYPVVGTFDQIDMHQGLASSILATTAFLAYAWRINKLPIEHRNDVSVRIYN